MTKTTSSAGKLFIASHIDSRGFKTILPYLVTEEEFYTINDFFYYLNSDESGVVDFTEVIR